MQPPSDDTLAGAGRDALPTRAQIDLWADRVRHTQEHGIAALGGSPPDPSVAVQNEVLEQAFEELSVAGEELRTQQEALADAHLQLERERTHYRSLFECAPVAYVVTDRAGVVRQANEAAARLLGAAGSKLGGKPLAVFVPAAGRPQFRRALLRLHERDISSGIEIPVAPRDGAPRLVSATVGAVRDASGVVQELRWLLVDETERRRRERETEQLALELEARVAARTAALEAAAAEKEVLLRETERQRQVAERADRAKSDLLATVSHELRTPLVAVAGYAELLEMGVHGPLNAQQSVDVARIQQAQEHIMRLLDDLLTYFRLGAQRLRVEVADVPVGEALAQVGPLVAPQAETRGVAFHVAGGDPNVIVHVDAERVQQIVLNLLSNAVKYTPRGGRVEMGWSVSETEVLVRVTDSGIGIPADRLDIIFEPFVQLNDSTIPSIGYGLGLAISRELARLMGGDLVAESAAGEGSVFTLRLPRG